MLVALHVARRRSRVLCNPSQGGARGWGSRFKRRRQRSRHVFRRVRVAIQAPKRVQDCDGSAMSTTERAWDLGESVIWQHENRTVLSHEFEAVLSKEQLNS